MMASNLLSRLIPPGNPSVCEALRDNDHSSDESDIEERAGMATNVGDLNSQDTDLSPPLPDGTGNSIERDEQAARRVQPAPGSTPRPPWLSKFPTDELDEVNDDVPVSLLIEANQAAPPRSKSMKQESQEAAHSPVPMPGRPDTSSRTKWNQTRNQQKLYREPHVPPAYNARPRRSGDVLGNPRERALWRWANVQNLDNFLRDVYDYYLGHGIWSILLGRAVNLLTTAFVIGFSVFLTSCIDYRKLPTQTKLVDVLIPRCTQRLSGFWNLLIWLCVFFWFAKLVQYMFDIRRLKHIHDFYHYLLEVPDTDIQTISWQDIVKRLMDLRDLNHETAVQVSDKQQKFLGNRAMQRMDAHDIANRLMRRDNYLIALINKDVLDITLPLPLLGNKTLFSKSLEWNLSLCILDFVFDDRGQVCRQFLKDSQRKALSDSLRRRFILAGLINILCVPFIIVYLVVFYFFRYFNEYHKNPSSISLHQYSPLAEWKFREFNELWHLFEKRLNMSYPFASRYINQFPKDKTVQAARFVAFVSGALAGVLAVISLLDPDLFLGFEITHDRTVLFYLGVLTAIWAFASGAVPEENLVFDPEYALTAVVGYTHYLPSQWRGRLHSDEVRKDFSQLYPLKIHIFLEELLSIVSTPFILWFSLPRCSERIVDFFREFTVHVDGLGYVCSFAVFDFQKGGNNTQRQKNRNAGNDPNLREDYYSTKNDKMLASYYNFVDNYVTNPKQAGNANMQGRHFYPPPAFPGLMTSNLVSDRPVASPRNEAVDRPGPTSRYGAVGFAAAQRTPRSVAVAAQASPMTSILLDPQHQPSGVPKVPPKALAQSRLRNSRKPAADLVEDDEEYGLAGPSKPGVSALSGDTDDDTQLDSWKTTQAAVLDDDDDEDGDGLPTTAERGPGVLGLVYQFSKAQTEGKGAGVQI